MPKILAIVATVHKVGIDERARNLIKILDS